MVWQTTTRSALFTETLFSQGLAGRTSRTATLRNDVATASIANCTLVAGTCVRIAREVGLNFGL